MRKPLKFKLISSVLFCTILLLIGWCGFICYEPVVEEPKPEEEVEMEEVVPFESLFRQYAPQIGWEWEMLAALCWEESRLNPNATAASGARGLMQLMPKTGQRFGLNDSTFCIPEDNIRAGVKYIQFLQKTFKFITDSVENQHFVLASYNAGPAHIMDARRLARTQGYSPNKWFGHTEYWLNQLQDPDVAADSTIVYYGTFNPKETISHVKRVKKTYNRILNKEVLNTANTSSNTDSPL